VGCTARIGVFCDVRPVGEDDRGAARFRLGRLVVRIRFDGLPVHCYTVASRSSRPRRPSSPCCLPL